MVLGKKALSIERRKGEKGEEVGRSAVVGVGCCEDDDELRWWSRLGLCFCLLRQD